MILHMENYSLLLFLLLFIISAFGSLTRSDYNATYALFSYLYLSTHKGKTALGQVLTNLLLMTLLMLGGDIWAVAEQNMAAESKTMGIVLIGFEIGLKALMLILLGVWKFRG